MTWTRKTEGGTRGTYKGRRPFQHWYRDNQVYFLTARCRNRFPAFASETAKLIFWDRFGHYTQRFGFTPWVTSLLDNHYHCLGYLKTGENLGPMMRHLHGAVAKLVNDELPDRLRPFWRQSSHHNYFDGCIRDEAQARRAYRYTLIQSVRHGFTDDWRAYSHTRINVELERAIQRSLELDAFLQGVPYRRYQSGGNG